MSTMTLNVTVGCATTGSTSVASKRGKMNKAPKIDEVLGFPDPVSVGIFMGESMHGTYRERRTLWHSWERPQCSCLYETCSKVPGDLNPLIEQIEAEYMEKVSTASLYYFDCLDCGNAI